MKTWKIVILDGYTTNPGDLSWDGFKALGELTVYDRTPIGEPDEIVMFPVAAVPEASNGETSPDQLEPSEMLPEAPVFQVKSAAEAINGKNIAAAASHKVTFFMRKLL